MVDEARVGDLTTTIAASYGITIPCLPRLCNCCSARVFLDTRAVLR